MTLQMTSLGYLSFVAMATACSNPSESPGDGAMEGDTGTSPNAEADWRIRSGQDLQHPQPGVVWFHDFRSDAEVDSFRWTPGYQGGNDPTAVGSAEASLLRRNPSDGVTGGGCLEIQRKAGTEDGSHWWRPLSPIVGSGNGRGQDDPGANGTIPAQAYASSDGGSEIAQWGSRGYYGHASYHSGAIFDGDEYYLQMRVKMDPRRTTAGNTLVGKLLYQTITDYSLSSQEIVTYSGAFTTPGGPNYFRMYGGGSFSPLEDLDSLGRTGQQVGSQLGSCDIDTAPGACWSWSGGWDTVMYHVVPGRDGVQETHIEIFAAHPGETMFVKIWDELFINFYDNTSPKGYSAIIASVYNNGNQNSEFWHRYDQLIFSKQPIPCPQY